MSATAQAITADARRIATDRVMSDPSLRPHAQTLLHCPRYSGYWQHLQSDSVPLIVAWAERYESGCRASD